MFTENHIKQEGWELYDIENYRTEIHDLSKVYSEIVRELFLLFEAEVKRTLILPKK